MTYETVEISEDEYAQARYDRMGWCPNCEAFTTPGIALQDVARSCLSCFSDGVIGAGRALESEWVRVVR